jgi:hypothetical protein
LTPAAKSFVPAPPLASADVFERMDEIDWGVLEHAYGPAKDVPETLRALASADAGEREKARHTLYGTIFHQGTRYEATAHAVPFLLELLADPSTHDRAELARLLATLAVGYDEQWLPGTFPVARYRERAVGGAELLRAAPPVVDEWADDAGSSGSGTDSDDDDDDDGVEERYSWYESLSDEDASTLYSYVELAAYDAVRVGVPLFRSLLADDDAELRTAAAYLLAWFPEDAAGSVPALAAVEDDGIALVALGLLGSADDAAFLLPKLADDRELVRWGAAVGLASLQGPAAGREVVAELLTWAGGPAGERDDMPFLRGDIGGVAVLALRRLDPAYADVAFDALLGRLRSVSGMPAVTVLYEALRHAWPDGEQLPAGTPFAALSSPQQRLLHVLATSPDTWRLGDHPGLFGNFTSLLAHHNLPRTPTAMHTYTTTPSR